MVACVRIVSTFTTKDGCVYAVACRDSKNKAEIAELESDLEGSTDTQIREVIEIRIKELRRTLAQLQRSRRGDSIIGRAVKSNIAQTAISLQSSLKGNQK